MLFFFLGHSRPKQDQEREKRENLRKEERNQGKKEEEEKEEEEGGKEEETRETWLKFQVLKLLKVSFCILKLYHYA